MKSSAVHWYNRIPDHVKEILQTLHSRGFEAFLAGGAVRDFQLGLEPKDYDVATDASPDEVSGLFSKTLDIGKAFGITMVITPKGTVEVARFRSDGTYSNLRHPDQIEFSTPEEDAKRRDFTINALFFDPKNLELIDYVGGLKDIEKKTIRAVGDPAKRIQEDALRMLRAVRFSAQFSPLGFKLDDALMSAIQKFAANIQSVSKERITQEFLLILKSRDPLVGVAKLIESGLWKEIFPSTSSPDQTAIHLHLQNWKKHFQDSSWLLCFASIFWQQSLETLSQNLLLDSDLKQQLNWLNSEKPKHLFSADLALKKVSAIHPSWREGLILHGSNNSEASEFLHWRDQQEKNQTLNPAPLISGEDLKKLGFSAGPKMGAALRMVREAQLREEISSKEEALKLAKG
jgi:poly(A) polymerase